MIITCDIYRRILNFNAFNNTSLTGNLTAHSVHSKYTLTNKCTINAKYFLQHSITNFHKMLVDTTSTMSISVPEVGKRIECVGQFGSIKYIGPVEAHPAIWLGIDWDDPERGKHNGCVNGVQYFKTRHPTSGSFIRPEKVNLGQSVLKAITSRYGKKEDDITTKIHQQQLLSIQQKINAPFLQLVGFDDIREKQSNFNSLQVVNLRMQCVRGSGNAADLKKLCPNLTELDLSKNLFSKWSDIFDICSQLEHLFWLNVSENIMEIPDDVTNWCFPNLRILISGRGELTWLDILKLSKVFPNLEELRVPFNKIASLDIPEEHNFQHLMLLDIENNHIHNWSEICKLGNLPRLEALFLENTDLESIHFIGSENGKTELFKCLKKLVISENKFQKWEDVGELNKLQNLKDLRFIRNPVMNAETYDTCVQLLVAKIANLEMLNGSIIKSDERKGAEYDYIKKYGLEWLAVRNTNGENEFLMRHNRYSELLEKHGTPEESELKVEPKVIQGSLVEIEIAYNNKALKKKLPPTLVIQKLIMLIQRLFNLSSRPTLLYVSGTQPDIEICLDDEGKELGFYSIQQGDKIIVRV